MKCSKNNLFTKDVSTQLIMFIKEHQNEKLRIDDLVIISGFSKFYLQSFFKEHTGISLGRFIRDTHLQHAVHELVHSQSTILSIALNAGYSSQQSFHRAFRKKYKITPCELRRSGVKNIHL
ncbi:helix-turn-helix transcriptional regulator [Citrobacter sp.]|uniref:helix-turn-helix transcriptional regulator n=1 Tax=Citrobacter sp. TaxID=1896336 RepID=UPI003FA5989A